MDDKKTFFHVDALLFILNGVIYLWKNDCLSNNLMAINDGDCVFKEEIRIKLKIVWTRFKWSFLFQIIKETPLNRCFRGYFFISA